MTPESKLLAFYGSQGAIAEAYGVTRQAVSLWIKNGLPLTRAAEFQKRTRRRITMEEIFLQRAQQKRVA